MPISSTPPKIAMPSFPGDFCIFESRTVVAAVAIGSFKLTGIGPSHRPTGRNYTQQLLRECEKWRGIWIKSLRLLLGEEPTGQYLFLQILQNFSRRVSTRTSG